MVFSVSVHPYGNGKMVWLKTDSLRVGIANFGATVSSVQVYHPHDKKWVEVNCGYPHNPEEAEADVDYMGVTVGRCAGRVKNCTFVLDGKTYHTDANIDTGSAKHTCHCGIVSYHKKHWGFVLIDTADKVGVQFSYTSPHMENGFPAELYNTATFAIERSSPNTLRTRYEAFVTEASPADATAVNIFNHCYWNLNGVPERDPKAGSGACWKQPVSIDNHWVRVAASRVAVADCYGIPTGSGAGDFASVDGTCLDFRKGRVLKDGLADVAVLDRDPCGYDHPLAVDGWEKGKLSLQAEAKSPITNIHMKVYSTYPVLWVYTANKKPLPASGLPGARYERWSCVGLEPQYFSDCANHYDNYPSCIIRRGRNHYSESLVNEFTVDGPSRL